MYSPYSVSDIKRLCARHRIRPSKTRGQNFLIDERVADAVVNAAALDRHGTVIEVGPGLGALTFKLAERAGEVTALEIEKTLVSLLVQELQERNLKNVSVVETDALQWWRTRIPSRVRDSTQSQVIANLPYSITSDFFTCILRDECLPRTLTVMVQKEVAARMTARPPHLSMLSVVAQWYGSVEMVAMVPQSAFWPQPAVESAVVHLDTMDASVHARRAEVDSAQFLSFVRRAFSSPRKKIKSTLGTPIQFFPGALSACVERRPSELTVDNWYALYRVMREK